jgi:adenylate cyclase
MDVESVFDWLVDGAPGAETSVEVIEKMGADLVAAGIPIERMSAFVTTLHPTVIGRAFWWSRGQPVKIGELTTKMQESDGFKKSPVADVFRTKVEVRRRIEGIGPSDYQIYRDLAVDGFTDYVCLPMPFIKGQVHAIAFATKRAGGFSDADLASLRRVLRPLSRVAEILALHRTASNILSTYVGRNSGERVLAGRIFKGDIETLRAVIWFSDLRGFTEMSSRMTSREIIDTLNELFECQVSTIERHGGEVLKFIGDGLLAIFPLADQGEVSARATAALEAADDAFAALAARNEASAKAPIRFGLALHVGEVAYGNIGGASRLDFTAIGPAVNLAARLEGLTGKLGRSLLLSAELARHVSRPLEDVGAFELKGVAEPQRVFAPRA